jgi:hypothetical protein
MYLLGRGYCWCGNIAKIEMCHYRHLLYAEDVGHVLHNVVHMHMSRLII